MRILLTGGTGYIGSHVCVELLNCGYEVVIIDNLSNSKKEVINRIQIIVPDGNLRFYQIDLLNFDALDKLLAESEFDAVMHFAGFKAVGESVAKPLAYYENNVQGTINLLKAMQRHQVRSLVFSSSATVYGSNPEVPFYETHPLEAINPYGRTKLFIEEILRDYTVANKTASVSILRYFNPVGAHESGLIGEDPKGIPNNLMPIVSKVAAGRQEKLVVYGNDYSTQDGTCIRDYIHVVDLAIGHVRALERHLKETGIHVYNLGRGKGLSVLEIIKAYETANEVMIKHVLGPRRPGDTAISFADVSKANKQLGWFATRDEYKMCRDSWNWQLKSESALETVF
jgi:UDP-glucose 4-epimerase